MKKTYTVSWMHCASCATLIQGEMTEFPDISTCEVNLVHHTATLHFTDHELPLAELNKKIQPLGYTFQDSSWKDETGGIETEKPKEKEYRQAKKEMWISIPFIILSLFLMARMLGAEYNLLGIQAMPEGFHYFATRRLLPLVATFIIFTIGRKYLKAVWLYLSKGKATMDTLVGIGTGFAYLFSIFVTLFGAGLLFDLTGASWLEQFQITLSKYIEPSRVFYEAVIIVIGFISIGKYMEQRTMSHTGQAIKALLNLQVKKARKLSKSPHTREEFVDIEDIQKGDLLLIKPGEKIPLDGIIRHWTAHLDESMITGESLPISKTEGETVIGSTLLLDSPLTIETIATGNETYLAKIIAVVEEAQNSKPQIQYQVDKIMNIFIPTVFGISLTSTLIWLLIGGLWRTSLEMQTVIRYAIQAFIGVLVIACPCGLGLATPMAIITGLGHSAKNGILAKNADGLIKLRKVKYIAFDKTGTITEGTPTLVNLHPLHKNTAKPDKDELQLLASLEATSTHPIAHAILTYAEKNTSKLLPVQSAKNHAGKGISWIINGTTYFVGNRDFVSDFSLSFDETLYHQRANEGKTPLILFTEKEVLWLYAVADTIKPIAIETIKKLKENWIIPVMITGDHENTAKTIATQVGIDNIFAQIKPEEKAEVIQQLKHQLSHNEVIAMVGDGINDAPALATADIGIAMATGTDVAIESADITLLHGDISKVLKAIEISKLTQSAINQNLLRAFGYNVIGIPLAAGAFFPFFGRMLNPAFEGAAMAFSDLTVVGNSLRLQAKKI